MIKGIWVWRVELYGVRGSLLISPNVNSCSVLMCSQCLTNSYIYYLITYLKAFTSLSKQFHSLFKEWHIITNHLIWVSVKRMQQIDPQRETRMLSLSIVIHIKSRKHYSLLYFTLIFVLITSNTRVSIQQYPQKS